MLARLGAVSLLDQLFPLVIRRSLTFPDFNLSIECSLRNGVGLKVVVMVSQFCVSLFCSCSSTLGAEILAVRFLFLHC